MNIIDKEEFEATSSLFIEAIHKYFNHLTLVTKTEMPESETGVPFVKEREELMLKEYTGMIGISGNRKGFVYFSGNLPLYADLIRIFLKREEYTNDQVLDMAGEVSNVIAGNVRETYGNDFMITVPIVFQGKPDHLKFPDDVPIFVIPIKWKDHEALVVIGLE